MRNDGAVTFNREFGVVGGIVWRIDGVCRRGHVLICSPHGSQVDFQPTPAKRRRLKLNLRNMKFRSSSFKKRWAVSGAGVSECLTGGWLDDHMAIK